MVSTDHPGAGVKARVDGVAAKVDALRSGDLIFDRNRGDLILFERPGEANFDDLAGMTADHSVVVVTFSASNGYHQGYFHNANGWFHLESALCANGVAKSAR